MPSTFAYCRLLGKTFSAEATSEHVKKPLYVIGSGELGTTPEVLDQRLGRILDVATTWKAIVLIDEVCVRDLLNGAMLI